jgi:hypothetical protein
MVIMSRLRASLYVGNLAHALSLHPINNTSLLAESEKIAGRNRVRHL